ncbi:MAG TPA: hypothetical protein DCY13_07410 [Verrucomicrobiales bacterium]|nr:hypothetical protein [Verrucomicrobiales bacterium]
MSHAHLHELFPAADFGFSMKLRPGDVRQFFEPSPDQAAVLAERRRWLNESPERYVAATSGAEREIAQFRRLLDGLAEGAASDSTDGLVDEIARLGGMLEPDFLLLTPGQGGRFHLRAGCVCFPSGWALAEKIGQPMEEIHGIVPGLNPAIGERIHQFLSRLKPGAAWLRSNWGISSSPERNQHPGRAINRMSAGTSPAATWLRVEHQVLHRLDDCDGVLFGIRLENVPLAAVRQDRSLRAGLHRSLATMPDDMAVYKNLQQIRPALLKYLESSDLR